MRRPGIPVFFRLWFAFCAILALTIAAATVNILLHPEWIGEFVGRVVTGYSQAAPHSAPAPPVT